MYYNPVLYLQMIIDTMLLCFCHDCDINDGTPERPYYAGASLMVSSYRVVPHFTKMQTLVKQFHSLLLHGVRF